MKKNTALKLMYLIIAILFLQVVKALITRIDWDYGFFAATIISALQFLLLFMFPLAALCRLLFRKLLPSGTGVLGWLMAFLLIALAEWQFTSWLKNPSVMPDFLKESYRYYYFHNSYHIAQFDEKLCAYDPRLFYTLKPGVTGSFANAEFRHQVRANSRGMRDDDSSLHRRPLSALAIPIRGDGAWSSPVHGRNCSSSKRASKC